VQDDLRSSEPALRFNPPRLAIPRVLAAATRLPVAAEGVMRGLLFPALLYFLLPDLVLLQSLNFCRILSYLGLHRVFLSRRA